MQHTFSFLGWLLLTTISLVNGQANIYIIGTPINVTYTMFPNVTDVNLTLWYQDGNATKNWQIGTFNNTGKLYVIPNLKGTIMQLQIPDMTTGHFSVSAGGNDTYTTEELTIYQALKFENSTRYAAASGKPYTAIVQIQQDLMSKISELTWMAELVVVEGQNWTEKANTSAMAHQVTRSPTRSPTIPHPTMAPTVPQPSMAPTVSQPSMSPTVPQPSMSPTFAPTMAQPTVPSVPTTLSPTMKPTTHPTMSPTTKPTLNPTQSPTTKPTKHPTMAPTTRPTKHPTMEPTVSPTVSPTLSPTIPTKNPTRAPTTKPTKNPTRAPTTKPTKHPTMAPTTKPTASPVPTKNPTNSPTTKPTKHPTMAPTIKPTKHPTMAPTTKPTSSPIAAPTAVPTAAPIPAPTPAPAVPSRRPPQRMLLPDQIQLAPKQLSVTGSNLYEVEMNIPPLLGFYDLNVGFSARFKEENGSTTDLTFYTILGAPNFATPIFLYNATNLSIWFEKEIFMTYEPVRMTVSDGNQSIPLAVGLTPINDSMISVVGCHPPYDASDYNTFGWLSDKAPELFATGHYMTSLYWYPSDVDVNNLGLYALTGDKQFPMIQIVDSPNSMNNSFIIHDVSTVTLTTGQKTTVNITTAFDQNTTLMYNFVQTQGDKVTFTSSNTTFYYNSTRSSDSLSVSVPDNGLSTSRDMKTYLQFMAKDCSGNVVITNLIAFNVSEGSSSSSGGSSSLSGGEIAGIAIGGVLLLLIIAYITWRYVKNKRGDSEPTGYAEIEERE